MASRQNQHFVPKFYLRKFSYDNNQRQIGVYNTETHLYIQRAKLKHQAYNKYFYGKDGSLEVLLCSIEGDAASLLKTIEETRTIPKLNQPDHESLLFFVILSSLRNPIISKNLEESHDKIFGEAYKDHEDYKQMYQFFKKYDNEVLRALSGVSMSFESTIDLHLKLLVNKSNIPFVTSDNPVVRYNQYLEKRDSKRGLTGFGCKGLQMLFPVSPDKMLVFYDHLVYKLGNRKQDVVELTDPNEIDQINILQFLNCEKIVFFNHNVSEEQVREYSKKSSKYEKANRVSVTKHKLVDDQGAVKDSEYLLVSATTDCRTQLQLQCIKETKTAKKKKIDVNKLQVRKIAASMLNQ